MPRIPYTKLMSVHSAYMSVLFSKVTLSFFHLFLFRTFVASANVIHNALSRTHKCIRVPSQPVCQRTGQTWHPPKKPTSTSSSHFSSLHKYTLTHLLSSDVEFSRVRRVQVYGPKQSPNKVPSQQTSTNDTYTFLACIQTKNQARTKLQLWSGPQMCASMLRDSTHINIATHSVCVNVWSGFSGGCDRTCAKKQAKSTGRTKKVLLWESETCQTMCMFHIP